MNALDQNVSVHNRSAIVIMGEPPQIPPLIAGPMSGHPKDPIYQV